MLEIFPFDGFSVYVREGYFILGESAYSLVIVGSEYHLSVKEVENTNDKQLYIPSTNDISWWYHYSNTKLNRLKILILASFVKDFIGGKFFKIYIMVLLLQFHIHMPCILTLSSLIPVHPPILPWISLSSSWLLVLFCDLPVLFMINVTLGWSYSSKLVGSEVNTQLKRIILLLRESIDNQ